MSIKLVDARKDPRFGRNIGAEKPTFYAGRAGWEYGIYDEQQVAQGVIKFTDHQMRTIFLEGIPLELLVLIPKKDLANAHLWRMQNDAEYKAMWDERAKQEAAAKKAAEAAAKKNKPEDSKAE